MTIEGMNPKKATSKSKGSSAHTVAVHEANGDTRVVGIGNLRVIVCKDDDAWFAQGLEIDYAANGHNLAEVKKNFEDGLRATLDLHIKAYGNIEHILNAAPPAVWKELWKAGRHFEYSQVSLHSDLSKALGFDGMTYIETKSAPEAEVAA